MNDMRSLRGRATKEEDVGQDLPVLKGIHHSLEAADPLDRNAIENILVRRNDMVRAKIERRLLADLEEDGR